MTKSAAKWKVYDLGPGSHGGKELHYTEGRLVALPQRRYFCAGSYPGPLGRYQEGAVHTRRVAQKIVAWRNEWEDLRLEAAARAQARERQRSSPR